MCVMMISGQAQAVPPRAAGGGTATWLPRAGMSAQLCTALRQSRVHPDNRVWQCCNSEEKMGIKFQVQTQPMHQGLPNAGRAPPARLLAAMQQLGRVTRATQSGLPHRRQSRKRSAGMPACCRRSPLCCPLCCRWLDCGSMQQRASNHRRARRQAAVRSQVQRCAGAPSLVGTCKFAALPPSAVRHQWVAQAGGASSQVQHLGDVQEAGGGKVGQHCGKRWKDDGSFQQQQREPMEGSRRRQSRPVLWIAVERRRCVSIAATEPS